MYRQNGDVALISFALVIAIGTLGIQALVLRRTRRLKRVLAAANAIAGLFWIYADGPIEGSVIVSFSSSHGVTSADLLGVASIALAIALSV